MNKLKEFSHQALLTEVKSRISKGEIEIEWEFNAEINSFTYYDVKQKKRTRMNFNNF